jgi:predicted component of type VI protein secretion system
VLARIRYQDDQGEQIYIMTKNQIVVGRGGIDYWVDLRLNAAPDVSREHLRLRRDDSSGQFFVKDLSKFGTSVDGKRIPSSVEVVGKDKQDKDVWVPIPSKARIGLADVMFLDFEAS